MEKPYWSEMLQDVLAGRVEKPRLSGLTMVMDAGVSITMMRDIFQLAASHIDFWKFAFASASVCPPERILDKITLCQEYDVLAYPGGTSLEIIYSQGDWKAYLQALWTSGVRVVEISDGTIELPLQTRREMIREAKKIGLMVLTKVGKKARNTSLSVDEQAQLMKSDLANGASYVIVEGSTSSLTANIYDGDGNIREQNVQMLLHLVGPYRTRLIWETPRLTQQAYYIGELGNQVNLGNVNPEDIVTLESLRRGFFSDTLHAMRQDTSGSIQGDRSATVVDGSHTSDASHGRYVEPSEWKNDSDGPTLWKINPTHLNQRSGINRRDAKRG